MSINLSSPGINIIELDNTRTATPKVKNKLAVIVLPAEKGEVNKLTLINSETELVNIFGKPNEYNYQEWFSILSVLSYGKTVGVIRPYNKDLIQLTNANVTTSNFSNNITIDNIETYNNDTKNYKFAAKTPTKLYNGLKIVAIDHGADQILTLNNSTTNDTILPVTSSTGFANNDYIRINNEFLLIQNITGNNITVTRSVLGSTTEQHSIGDKIVKWVIEENTNPANNVDVLVSAGTIETTDTFITLNTNIPASFQIGKYLKIKRTPTGGTTSTTSEIVRLVGINTLNNTIEVERGELGTNILNFEVVAISDETSVTVEIILMNINATTPVTTLTNDFPYKLLPSFTGNNGDLVYGVNSNKIGWVYSQYSDKLVVVLNDNLQKFSVGETIYSSNGITPIGEITKVENYYDTQYILPGIPWINLAPQPNTSTFGLSKGAKFDEFHLVVIDETGNITGTPNNILEKFTYLNKSSNGLSEDGIPNYWLNVIESKSEHIYGGNQDISIGSNLVLDLIPNTNYVNGVVNNENTNKLFNLFKNSDKDSNLKLLLNGGTSYDWSSPTVVSNVINDGYDLVSNPEIFGDVDYLLTGTVNIQKVLKLINICNNRKDCKVVISPNYSDVINSSSSKIKAQKIVDFFDKIPSTSYAILESSYIQIYDKYNNVYRYIPGSGDVVGLCLSTPEVWLAPSGVVRGVFKNGLKLAYSPNKAERDLLYTHRVNPVVSYSGVGIVLYGNKTALNNNSALSRIEIRTLFTELQKIVSNYLETIMFENNNEDLWEQFLRDVTPILEEYKFKKGIGDYKITVDSTTNTVNNINNYEFAALIQVKPLRSINYANLYFSLVNEILTITEEVN